jgi:hypothetical protein
MPKTIDLLFKSILNGDAINTPVITDYFGIHNAIDDNKYSIIYGIYEGLIKYKGISKDLLENCYMTNRLDELINKKYTHQKSNYYLNFVINHISIGETYFNFDDNQQEKMVILTDDYCSSCNTFGFYTKQNYKLEYNSPPDCFKCGNNICKMCSNYDNKDKAFICYKCENPNIISCIKSKICGYNKSDIENFGVIGNIKKEDVISLLNKQKFRCYVCDDIVLTFGYKPHCLYQFSVDRIDNSLPHNTDNILISCYYCNCISYLTDVLNYDDNKKYKICDNYCHCEKRNISIKREDVSIDKITSLKLS